VRDDCAINDTAPPPGPANIANVIPKRLTIRGFLVLDHAGLMPEFLRDMAGWYHAGKMKWREIVVEGLENAPDAFIGLFRGENIGKMLVNIGPDSAV
jgi:NADPH-dependent curcumin reductase CurA